MPAWLPILTAALPYVGNIVSAALPAFTSRKEQDASAELVARQIAELQAAVTGNAETIKGLASQVEQTMTALAEGESDLARRLAAMQDAVARCETTGALAQAQSARLDGVATALQVRVGEFEQQLAGARRRNGLVAAIALVALSVALFALLRS
jgi:chromosome segregation ATPase